MCIIKMCTKPQRHWFFVKTTNHKIAMPARTVSGPAGFCFCLFCVSALFHCDVPSPNDVWRILVQSYQKLLLHSHTWVAPGEWFLENGTMMNHEPWSLEKNFKIQSYSIDVHQAELRKHKRYQMMLQLEYARPAPKRSWSSSWPKNVATAKSTNRRGSNAATRGELWTDLKMTNQHTEIKAKRRKKTCEMMWDCTKSRPSSDLIWPKHLPHCEPS